MAFVPKDEVRFRNEGDGAPLYDFVDFVSVDYIFLLEIDADVKKLGIRGFANYFWTTNVEKLGDSLEKLQTDEDTLKMTNQALREGNYVHLYIVTKLAQVVLEEYIKEEQARKVPSNVRIEELEDENPPC
ncbi:hypothetical protein CRG98_008968 [Punica granatum]|uniref:PB1-like domain-containing protein n=1 Tax=Punica granatum TaxID=22663 RepID=A0A2I0KQG1_PUNGR|nr:hypothetical protein CRG98_008968 [Punica granatum]